MWKAFKNESQNNLTKPNERLESTDFTHFPVQMRGRADDFLDWLNY